MHLLCNYLYMYIILYMWHNDRLINIYTYTIYRYKCVYIYMHVYIEREYTHTYMHSFKCIDIYMWYKWEDR